MFMPATHFFITVCFEIMTVVEPRQECSLHSACQGQSLDPILWQSQIPRNCCSCSFSLATMGRTGICCCQLECRENMMDDWKPGGTATGWPGLGASQWSVVRCLSPAPIHQPTMVRPRLSPHQATLHHWCKLPSCQLRLIHLGILGQRHSKASTAGVAAKQYCLC
jgi:hypothetical protein